MNKLPHWVIPAIFGAVVFVAAALTVKAAWPCSDPIKLGTFILSALTLIALAWYTYDTNLMAKISRERWVREGILSTTYGLDLLPADAAGRTLLKLVNPSTLVVRARVNCNFRVYGVPVSNGPAYDGREVWLLFPQQFSQGWFEVEAILQQRGKTIAAMTTESTDANAAEQLTMRLELQFWDELDNHRELPARKHYFDFRRWAWIPFLTEESTH
jgi:hypothetical protein